MNTFGTHTNMFWNNFLVWFDMKAQFYGVAYSDNF